ncbi:FimB/Mfa2 family fimbrial subunit [Dysgonomonas termitidis]|uniref:FimB/Mfa2 family fimbrial subunit n=1 Tax=Dysgonomonas termitidis TaxID=1516126 RepID=A0ABV9L0N4_9BACT
MNLSSKPILLTGLIILSIFSGCIKDDYKDCVQGINVNFYSKSSCDIDVSYPEQIKNLTIGVFDKNGILVSSRQLNDTKLQKDFRQTIETESGLYTVIAWSGINADLYDLITLKVGSTTKNGLLFRLKRAAQKASSINGTRVYYGESPAVYVPQADNSESIFENTAVNMQEITNRIEISVEGLLKAEEYEIEIESDNGSMNIDGSVASDEVIEHSAEHIVRGGVMEARFTLLKLETGHNNNIIIKSKLNGAELYRGSLLGTLLLKNPDVNLACDHDFIIRFTTRDQCSCGTYTIMEIWVNNWLVHSYETEI